jgi:hypothetical protein
MNAVYIAQCAHGRGLFVSNDLAAGDEILRFGGPLIPLSLVLARGEQQCNPLQVGEELYMDIGPPGVFANHSCNPNAGIVEDYILVALRTIQAGDEVFYDYSTTMWEGMWTMECRCGSTGCRGVVGDFPDLPADLRTEYLRRGVVQGFIRRRLRAGGMAEPPASTHQGPKANPGC